MQLFQAQLDQPPQPGWEPRAAAWEVMPERPIVSILVPILREDPHRAVLVFEDGVVLTAGQLLDGAERFAGFLRQEVADGAPVAIAVGNRAEFFVVWLAALATGNPLVNVDPSVGTSDATHILKDSCAVLVVVDDTSAGVMLHVAADSRESLRVLALGDGEPSGLDAHLVGVERYDLLTAPPSVHAVTSITYTSGTTGIPKGCTHQQGELCRYVDISSRLYDFRAGDRVLNPLQFFYGDSIWLFALCLKLGCEFISLRRFSVSRFWSVVEYHRVTTLFGIGSIPNLLLKGEAGEQESRSVRFAVQIGVPADQHAELIRRFGFPWYDAYGLSETNLNVAVPPTAADRYVGTGAIGVPVPEVDCLLLDEDGAVITGPGTGQLAVRSPYMMPEYLNRPDETAAAIRDGFFLTGDRVERDADGVFYFRGRLKEIIRRGGENIAPGQVEAVLKQHPAVEDAAVVPVPDPLWGEEVKAYVRLLDDVAMPDLAAHCAAELAPHKVPRFFEVREDPFPRTPSQRIRKRDLMSDGVHRTDTAWDRMNGADR